MGQIGKLHYRRCGTCLAGKSAGFAGARQRRGCGFCGCSGWDALKRNHDRGSGVVNLEERHHLIRSRARRTPRGRNGRSGSPAASRRGGCTSMALPRAQPPRKTYGASGPKPGMVGPVHHGPTDHSPLARRFHPVEVAAAAMRAARAGIVDVAFAVRVGASLQHQAAVVAALPEGAR